VVVARVAAATSTIRVGTGGVLLSHYSPLKVAETFRVLAGLFPGRIDLGLGRAEGAGPATAEALRSGVDGVASPFGQKVADLLALLAGTDGGVRVMPEDVDGPDVWLLSSSSDGAAGAAQLGLPLCFAHFISPRFGPQVVAGYRRAFQPMGTLGGPVVTVAAAVVCADTDAEAERLASSVEVWRLDKEEARGPVPSVAEARLRASSQLDRARMVQNRKGFVVGGPERVADVLRGMARDFGVDELVVLTVCHDPAARLRSYELLAGAFELPAP